MATQGKMNYGEVRNLANDLLAQAGNMETYFNFIDKEIKKINSGSGIFDGDAAATIVGNFNAFTSKFSLFSDAVRNCGNFVNNAVSTYESVDAEATKATSGLGGN